VHRYLQRKGRDDKNAAEQFFADVVQVEPVVSPAYSALIELAPHYPPTSLRRVYARVRKVDPRAGSISGESVDDIDYDGVPDNNRSDKRFVILEAGYTDFQGRKQSSTLIGLIAATFDTPQLTVHRILVADDKWPAGLLVSRAKLLPINHYSYSAPAAKRARIQAPSKTMHSSPEDDIECPTIDGLPDLVFQQQSVVSVRCTLAECGISTIRELVAVLSIRRVHACLLPAILNPGTAMVPTEQMICLGQYEATTYRRFLPSGAYKDHLCKRFNASQRSAIDAAVCSAGFTLIQGPPGSGKTSTILGILNTLHLTLYAMYHDALLASRRAVSCLNKEARETMHTHTIKLTSTFGPPEPQASTVIQHFDALPPVAIPEVLPSGTQWSTPNYSSITQLLSNIADINAPMGGWEPPLPGFPVFQGLALLYASRMDCLSALQTFSNRRVRPRILVTAPSNTAVDGILLKLLMDKFVDASTTPPRLYAPALVRIGEGATEKVRDAGMHLDTEVRKHMQLSATDCQTLVHVLLADRQQLVAELEVIKAAWLAACTKLRQQHAEFLQDHATALLRISSKFCRVDNKLSRILSVLNGRDDIMHDPAARRTLQDNLRNSLLQEAELIFSTTSSSSLSVLEEFTVDNQVQFDAVLVDEAAQAIEPSTLIPLLYGCNKAILVGDPCQLPATVISRNAAAAGLDQSLLGRLMDGGHPFSLLSIQYRCHPLIADFPSKRFYGGRLLNAESLKRTHPFHAAACFSPLLMYDLLGAKQLAGSEVCACSVEGVPLAGVRSQLTPTSWANVCEIQFIVNFVRTLAKWRGMDSEGRRIKFAGHLGIVTFYRNQVVLIEHVLHVLFLHVGTGSMPTAEETRTVLPFAVDVHTVDGFQGQERDAIILSCVRANTPTSAGEIAAASLGFVADPRRMNVALTRAKFACWIVCNSATLQASTDWAALRKHCVDTGAYVPVEAPSVDVFSLRPLAALPAGSTASESLPS
jgi:hypothetical protein